MESKPGQRGQEAPQSERALEYARALQAEAAAQAGRPPSPVPGVATGDGQEGGRQGFALGGRARKLALAVAAAGVLAGAFLYFGGAKDSVDPATQQQWSVAFAAAVPLRVSLIPAGEQAAALATMPLPNQDRARLQAELDNGGSRLVYLTLWDNVAEDGDRVRIDSGAYSFEVPLKQRPTRIAVPEPPGGTLNVTGSRDGGGGVTVGMMSGDARVNLPVMQVNQSLGVAVVSVP